MQPVKGIHEMPVNVWTMGEEIFLRRGRVLTVVPARQKGTRLLEQNSWTGL